MKPSGKYLLPANICPVVPLTFLEAGLDFDLVDISPVDLCMDRDIVLKKLRSDGTIYSGVLFARTYGLEGSFEKFFSDIKAIDKKIQIIDDRCLVKPSFEQEDTFADLVLFSTGYAKYTDIGSGAFAFLADSSDYMEQPTEYSEGDEKALMEDFKNKLSTGGKYIAEKPYAWLDNRKPEYGYPDRVLEHTDKVGRHKQNLNRIYRDLLPDRIQMDEEFCSWRFNIRVPADKKGPLLKIIFENGLFASSHYASLSGIFGKTTAPQAEALHQTVINLFNDFYFTVEQAEETCEVINKIL